MDTVLTPSLKGKFVPFPEKVPTDHPKLHGGSIVIPTPVHSEGTVQGTAAAGVPPVQKKPVGHRVAFANDVDPCRHPYPGEAVQGPEQVDEVKPVEAP